MGQRQRRRTGGLTRCGSGGRTGAETGELVADLLGVGVAEVVQDDERFFPGRSRLPGVPGGVPGIPDAVERLGLAPSVAHLTVQVEGALVASGRLGMVTEVMVGIAQAVPGGCLQLGIAEFLEQLERPPAVAERLPG